MIPTGIFVDGETTAHASSGHPERPQRLIAIRDALEAEGLLDRLTPLSVEPAPREALVRVHPDAYLRLLVDAAASGGGHLDPDTYLTRESFRIACRAAGAAMSGIDAVVTGRVCRAFVATRPPGHHASPTRGMGFCLINHVAVAAAHARDQLGTRVAIVDIDAHHGNGTQDVFEADGEVLFVSTHQHPFYPGTGGADEVGTGPGLGATINIPLPENAGDEALAAAMTRVVGPAVRRFAPSMIVVSLGFDGHVRDPLAELAFTVTGYTNAMRRLCLLADEVCDGRLLAFVEGGYDLPATAASAAATVAVMADLPVPPDPWGASALRSPDITAILDGIVSTHGLSDASPAADPA